VRYFSVAGEHEGTWRRPEWLFSHRLVLAAEGPNDGLVSVASASYGESTEVWEGDHVGLIKYGANRVIQACARWRDYTRHYEGLVGRLADEGF
jgi:triacylglycerol lipase